MDLSIIIANHNAEDYLLKCLDSIYKNTVDIEFEVIVIDNNSRDRSVELLRESFRDVLIIQNKINAGFAKAVNFGIGKALGKYILCLNNDTLVLPESLKKLVNFMDCHPEIMIAGAKVLNYDGSIQFSCRRFPDFSTALFNRASLLSRIFKNNKFSKKYLMSDWQHDQIRQVDWVSACYLIMRKDAVKKIGFFDERFFMYCEDIDLCLRAKNLGIKVYYLPDFPIIHLNRDYGDSFFKKIIEHHKSMFRYHKKHLSQNFFIDIIVGVFLVIRLGFILALNYLRHQRHAAADKNICETKAIPGWEKAS